MKNGLFALFMLFLGILPLSCDTHTASQNAGAVFQAVQGISQIRELPARHFEWNPKIDERTPEQLAQAACRAADGKWRCKGIKQTTVLAAGQTPIIPAFWTVTSLAFDYNNATGCAADTNNCTTMVCGAAGSGIGPCLTNQEVLIHRYQTYSPRLTQGGTVTITMQGTQSGNSDPFIFDPYIGNGTLVVFTGPSLASLTPVVSTTLSAVTAKNRATPQLLSDTLTAGSASVAVGMLANNTTHSLIQWVHSGTGPFLMTQGLVPATFPSTGVKPAEVDTSAATDAIKFYTLPGVNIVELNPHIIDYNGSFSNGIQLNHINIIDPSGTGNDHVVIGPQVWGVEISSQRLVQYVNTAYDNTELCTNCFLNGGMQGGSLPAVIENGGTTSTRPSLHFQGGQIGNASTSVFSDIQSADVDGDIILSNSFGATLSGSTLFGNVYIDTSVIASTLGAVAMNVSTAYGLPHSWGPGILNAASTSRIAYTAGAGEAVAQFLNTGGLTVNSQTKGCIAQPGASAIGACNTVVSPTTLDANGGATSVCEGPLGGGAFCNYGN